MANIKDVADRANVSITTVSHVINNTRYVSKELTERVNRAMKDLKYQPNTLARGLRSGKTRTIGLVIPDISNQFFAEISRKIEDKGLENGYSVILCNTDDDKVKEKNYIDVLVAKQVDGILFISAGEDSDSLEKTTEFNIPIVVVDRDIKKIDADIVLVDNDKAGFTATSFLIRLGHRRIACIAGPSLITPSAQRVAGYKSALKAAKISFEEELIVQGDYRYPSGENAMLKLLSLPEPPTAVFACNDMMALGAMRAVNNLGFKIPENISLIGFDNIPFSDAVYPRLTTMEQPIAQISDLAVDLLIGKINLSETKSRNKDALLNYERIILDANLIIRDSCKPIS